MAFRDLTIKRKLTVLMMGVSAAGALLACTVFYIMTMDHLKKTYHDDLTSLVQVLARNCESSLAFQLPEDAARIIATLSARPSVTSARIRDAGGAVFAEYGAHPDKPESAPGQEDPRDDGSRGYLTVVQDIVLGGKVIGSLSLHDDMRGIENAKTIAVSMMSLAILVSLGAVAVLAALLQKQISGPIMALSSSVERISREHDFSLRTEKAGSDEVGMLVDSFNAMIGQIEQGKAERGRFEAELRQAQKMEAIGALAGGVAHDFNNILSVIIGYASLMHVRMNPGDRQRQDLEQILGAAERAAGLTKSLLAFSRKQFLELKPIDVNDLIRQVHKMLGRLIGEDIDFTVACHPESLMVEADRGQLEQVLLNLVTNARDAMPRGGSLRITTSSLVIDERNSVTHNIPLLGTYAYITVSDTGTGMSKDTQEHIFEPFFTTKEVGKGTGLGLSIVYGIIKKQNGFVNVYSELGKGTSFKINLPVKPVSELRPHEGMIVPLSRVPRRSSWPRTTQW